MAKYSTQDKARALGALRASAEIVSGELLPCFREVAKLDGMPHHNTLAKWWREREVSSDSPVIAAVARAREDAAQEGAADLFKTAREAVKRQVEYISDPCHYSTETYTDATGRQHRHGARLDHATRALQVTLASIEQLRALLSEEGEPGLTPAQRAALAMRRTKLSQTLRRNGDRARSLMKEVSK